MAEKIDLEEGVKPVTGAPSSFGRGTAVRQLDDEGRIKTVRTSGAPLDTTNVKTPQEAANPERIGDYYYDSAKNLQVWENSPTDLLQKYRLAVGGTEKPAELLSPSGEALSILGPAVGAGVMAGAVAGGPVGVAAGAVAGLIGGLTNFNNAREEALKRWQEENVKYDSAVEFYKDDDGSVKYKVDYQKMGTGGPRSGERVKEAQNRETQVSLGDDGRLKVKVSPIFASTARFQEMMDFISTNYGNLSKDTENLDQVLTEIKNGIDDEAKDYISNMRLYADFAQKFQNASPETIVSSYTTEMAGYVDPTKMKDFQMTVLGDDDKVATRSAAEFFDSVLSMDKTGRNNLATKLNDIVYGESNNYSDDQRAIAYGELQAMYTASANPEKFENNKYQGMMDADGFVSFMNSFSPLGLNGGDVLKFLSGGAYSKQEMLNSDEWAQFFGGAAGIGAGFGMWKGGTSLIGAALKRLPGTAQLYAASATGQGMDNVKALFAAGETGKGIAAWAAEAGFKTLKVGAFDAALAGTQTAVSNEDFWSNFGQDFARDATLEAIFSYYDMVQMQNAVNESTVRLYVDKKTGQLRMLNEYKGEEFTAYEIGDDGLLTETTYKEGLKTNVWRTEKGGTGAVLQTPGGTTVTIVDGEVRYTPGAKVVEGEAVDVTEAFNEIPVMSTGVVNTSEGSIEVATLLEKAGLPKDTQVFEMSESAANAAMVAGKMAAAQNTKVGMEIYKQLFNKNGVLDVANNMALARDGDLNSWRNAQEYFVSIQNNAMRNLNDIQNGVYFREAATEWTKTVELMGKFNYEYKYKPKTDGAYINAILNIERAELLNQDRAEDDTTDYVAKALEVYGDVLAKMPTDRGELLQNWVQQGKKWLKTFNESVKKSGKVDIEKLENITDTDIDSEIGWFPVWGKKTKYKGLLDSFRGITKERNPYKSWLRDGEWVPADQLGDPWENMNRYMGFVTNNMGLNDMTEQAATVYDRAGLLVDNTPTDATIRKRKLESIKNKDELNKKLDEMIVDVKKEVEVRTLTPAQYSDTMTKIYEDSAIEETVEALANSNDILMASQKESEEIEFAKERFAKALKAAEDFNKLNNLYLKTGNEKYRTMAGDEINKRNEYLVDAGVNPLLMRPEGDWTGEEWWQAQHENYLAKLRAKSAGKVQQGDSSELNVFDEIPSTIEQKNMLDTSPESAPSSKYTNLKDYYAKEKGMEADFVYMTPDEYLEALLKKNGGISSYQTIDDIVKRSRETTPNHKGWRDYAEDMRAGNFNSKLSEGGKFPPPYLAYRASGVEQEGIHRALAARSLGITKMPVVVETPVKNKPAAAKKLLEGKARVKYPQSPTEQIPQETGAPQPTPEQQWDEFWKNAPAKTRKDIRNELEKTSLKTGYGISDTRARLNSQVPGADVLEWSLLGRDHTNGLVPSGLYAGKNSPVKAYIMSVDDLAKLVGYDLNNAVPGMGKVIEDEINIKGIVPMLPAHIRGSGDGPEIWLKMRWGHNSDGAANWTDYLKTLKERGIEKVPVAIDDTRISSISEIGRRGIVEEIDRAIATGDNPNFSVKDIAMALLSPGTDVSTIRRRIRRSIPRQGEAGVSHISDEDLDKILDEASKYDLLSDPDYERYRDEALELEISDILGYIPQDITADVQQAFSERGQIPFFHSQRSPLGSIEYNEPGKVPSDTYNGAGDAYWLAPNSSYTDNYGKNKIMGTIPTKYFMSDKEKNDLILKLEKRNWELFNKGYDNLSKKEKNEYDKIVEIIEPRLYKDDKPDPRYGEQGSKPEILSYRALAEYAKKPIIDISEDGFAAGTAFFYYKGVSPEFDEEIGQQLAIQALFDKRYPRWTSDEIANAMEEYDGMSLDEMIDFVTMGEGFGEGWDDLFEQFDAGEISSSELSEEVSKFFEGVEKRYPGIGKVMQETWDNNTIQDLRDMKFKYWHPSTGYPTIDDDVAAQFLEYMGLVAPQGGESVPEGQISLWDVVDPTNPVNVPTEPQFVQPRRRVTYEDYQKGLQADPEMAGRIRDSYRGAMANRLIKEATRVVALAEGYLSEYGYGADWQSYLNTSLIPDLQNAINQNMLPDEFSSFVQARIAQAMQDVAPYQSPELLLKSRLEGVAQEWRDWALKHIKAGRMTYDELRKFVNSHNLELPNDKRSYPDKIKHALWEMVQNNKRLPEIEGINPTAISKEMDKKLFYQMLDDTPLFQSIVKDKNELLDLVALERNKETTDSFTMGTAAIAAGLGGRYPMTWFKNGKPYTRFIKYDTKGHLLIAEQTTKALNDKELLKEDGIISKAATFVANDFRLLTTGWDPSRSLPNLARDTGRSFTIGRRFINAKEMLKSSIDVGSYTNKQRKMLEKAIDNAANTAANSSYNSAYRTSSGTMKDITKDYLSQSGANPMKRFFYNVVHDKRSILEWPMEFVEGYSRRANARSLAAVQLRKDQKAGANFKTQLKNAAAATEWAGREYTANFQRKGELIGRTSKYVAYQSSAYAGFDSMMRAFINDPKLVARNFAAFVLAYLVLLADTLSREETRKQYYRLSDYDRENQIVIGMGDSILTIPMDQELAGLLFPYRRIMETLNGTDPVSFFEFIWGSLTAALPPDLSGFSEGDGFNLSRGLGKLTSQNMPNLLTGIVEASTGYDLYYGTQTSVSKETLKDYGIYAPEPGDYTTTGKDSATLRGVANATGIPQWQLQVMLDNYGGNVGKYVLNTLDKLSGATKDQQGGKDFANTVFNSFTGLDQDAASNAFYAGITQLKDEKNKLIQKITNYNEALKTASGDTKIELQNKISQAKSDYGTKVGDFVDKYISAYEITGGLPKSQAQQIYFLFRLDDDDTLYQSGSVEEYYNNQAVQQFKNQATAMSAPILDKYYNNRLGNIYQDSEGVWRRYLSSGAQAMKNSVYGLGEQQKVDLLNILEGKNSNLKALRTQIKNARNQAFEAQDWDTRDALAYELDKQILQAISPYIEQYGAENVLGNTDVLEYLSEWFIVPDDFIRSKKGKYVSLGNNASTQKACVQPFIK